MCPGAVGLADPADCTSKIADTSLFFLARLTVVSKASQVPGSRLIQCSSAADAVGDEPADDASSWTLTTRSD
ncbi:hypothetical protein IG631_00047 [Alternaria alternata]|nr:hypothetical protein IG631_00047 [Alternaria alternata]